MDTTKLRTLRKGLGMTQQQVADQAQLSRDVIIKIEKNAPRITVKVVEAYAKAVNAQLVII